MAETKQLKADSNGIARAIESIKETLGKEGNLVKAVKIPDGGWEVELEVIEQSDFMKKIGIPKPVYDKNIYRVVLTKSSEISHYERKSQRTGGGQE